MKTIFQSTSLNAATMVAIELDRLLNADKGSDLAKAEHRGAFADSWYSNGRESGFHITNHETGKAVSFAEHRNSDLIVVYWGKGGDFDDSGVLSEEMYEKKHLAFFSPTPEGHRKAALYIVGKLF